MIKIINRSDYAVNVYPGRSDNGDRTFSAIIKCGYSFDKSGQLTPIFPTPAIRENNVYYDKAYNSSIKYAIEAVPFKIGSELLIYNSKYAFAKEHLKLCLEVSILFSNKKKWTKELKCKDSKSWIMKTGFMPSDPGPLLESSSLTIIDLDGKLKSLKSADVALADYEKENEDIQLQSKDLLDDVICDGSFGPIAPNYSVKSNKKASYNMAPFDQRFSTPFMGGEEITLKGFYNDSEVKLIVPELKFKSFIRNETNKSLLEPICDTLIIDTELSELYKLYSIPLSAKHSGNDRYLVFENISI